MKAKESEESSGDKEDGNKDNESPTKGNFNGFLIPK